MTTANKHPYSNTLESLNVDRFLRVAKVVRGISGNFFLRPINSSLGEGQEDVSNMVEYIEALRPKVALSEINQYWQFKVRVKGAWNILNLDSIGAQELLAIHDGYVSLDGGPTVFQEQRKPN